MTSRDKHRHLQTSTFDGPKKKRNPFGSQLTEFQAATLRSLADQAFSRAAGAAVVPGNSVRILRDATENYPAWIQAIESAERWVHFETYIIHDDEVGGQFADLLIAKAQQGIPVRLVYDWIGTVGNASLRFWRRLSKGGVAVRCFNGPNLDSPLAWFSRDHRKMISVDGKIAFVSGLCVGQPWLGYPRKGIGPWRDTGVEIRGPAVVDVERAFADTWTATGPALPADEVPEAGSVPEEGDISIRIVPTVPNLAGMYRIDLLLAAFARKTMWLSDAYFAGTASYIQALRAASAAGVDVRLLVPGVSDVPIMRAISRAGFRALLEAGIRVYEWDGPMMHAKTAVADGRWARVGSTNLNLTSWIGNRELDVLIEDERFAREMEEMFLDDLTHSTEIVLGGKRLHPLPALKDRPRRSRRMVRGKTSRAVVGVLQFGHAVGAAIGNRRELGPAESILMVMAASLLLGISLVAYLWPRALAMPTVIVLVWIALSLLVRAYKLYSKKYE
jgi:cardiolipin synthase A/B